MQYTCDTLIDTLICLLSILQLDADRDEEEVFSDISMTLDNKLFPSKNPEAGEKWDDCNNYRAYHLCNITAMSSFSFWKDTLLSF